MLPARLDPRAGHATRIVIPVINLSWHGGVRVLVQIANHLARDGRLVEFLVSRNRVDTPFQIVEGVKIKHVGLHTGFKLIDYAAFLLCVPFVAGRNAVLLANFFVTYYPVRLAALLTRVSYVYFVQDIESKYSPPFGILLNPLCRFTYRDRRIIAANAYLQDRLKAEFGATSRTMGVGPGREFFDTPLHLEKRYDIIYFPRREAWKGLDRFRRFLQINEGRCSCLCVSQDEELRKAIEGTDVTFVKPKDDEELIRAIDSAKVVLLTSYHEGFSLPPLEGMARGLPAVLYRCGGPELYIDDGSNGLYIDAEDRLPETISSLVNDSERYRRMSQNARKTAEVYRMDQSLQRMAQYLDECSSRYPSCGANR